METQTDAMQGRQIGSRIRLAGRVFGALLSVEEVVTERDPPCHKAWETTGEPRILLIGRYRMGFDITPENRASRLRVFIDYALPEPPRVRWLMRLLAAYYARWCTQRMVADAVAHFASEGMYR